VERLAVYENELIGSPIHEGLSFGGLLEYEAADTFAKAEFPGLRAIRLNGVWILARDLPDSQDVDMPDPIEQPWEFVKIRDQTSGNVALGTSDTTLASVTLPVPAHWSSGYAIEAEWQFSIADSSGGSTGAGIVVIGIVKLAGTQMGQDQFTEMTDSNFADNASLAGCPYIEGETTTGNRTLILTGSRTSAFAANASNRVLRVTGIHKPDDVQPPATLELWY
jgi:hypothetical protein